MSDSKDVTTVSKKTIIPAKMTHLSEKSCLMLFDDDHCRIKNYLCSFRLEMLPSINYNPKKVERVISFLNNLHGVLFLSTISEHTSLFNTGKIHNPNVEMPLSTFSMYEVVPLLYYKANALLMDAGEIINFTIIQELPFYTEISANLDDIKGFNPYVDEELWVKDLNLGIEEDSEDYIPAPWWRRNDGHVRDFFNNIDEKDVDKVFAFTINLGEEIPDEAVDDSDDPKKPDGSNDSDDDNSTIITL